MQHWKSLAYLYIVITYSLSDSVINKKSVRAVLVARSACRGSGIAHHGRTSKKKKPHAEYEYSKYYCQTMYFAWIYISIRHLLFASFLTMNEIYQISTSQERAQVNAFYYVCIPPLEPRPGFFIAVYGRKITKYQWYYQKYRQFFKPQNAGNKSINIDSVIWDWNIIVIYIILFLQRRGGGWSSRFLGGNLTLTGGMRSAYGCRWRTGAGFLLSDFLLP